MDMWHGASPAQDAPWGALRAWRSELPSGTAMSPRIERLCGYLVTRCANREAFTKADRANIERALNALRHAAGKQTLAPGSCAEVVMACESRGIAVHEELQRRALAHRPGPETDTSGGEPAVPASAVVANRTYCSESALARAMDDLHHGSNTAVFREHLETMQRARVPLASVWRYVRAYTRTLGAGTCDGSGTISGVLSPSEARAAAVCLSSAGQWTLPLELVAGGDEVACSLVPEVLMLFHQPHGTRRGAPSDASHHLCLARAGPGDITEVRPLDVDAATRAAVQISLQHHIAQLRVCGDAVPTPRISLPLATLYRAAVRYENPDIAREVVAHLRLADASPSPVPADAVCALVATVREAKPGCALALSSVAEWLTQPSVFDRAFTNAELAEIASCFAFASEASRSVFNAIEARVVWGPEAWVAKADALKLVRAFITAMVAPVDHVLHSARGVLPSGAALA